MNRERELSALDRVRTRGGLVVITGRRRIGKTRLLTRWMQARGGRYSQAIEGPFLLQISQTIADLRDAGLELAAVPQTWREFFSLVSAARDATPLCLDEFPYLVESSPELPSVLQSWLDHGIPKRMILILAGSNQRMMHSLFLEATSPLYGRAALTMNIEPMSFRNFCDAAGIGATRDSFIKFSLVGGIPRYWELLDTAASPIECASELYFGFAPHLEREPERLLIDNGIDGAQPRAILEAIGRGAERMSEIASRLGTVASNLNRPMQLLVDLGVVVRDIPFGESLRSTKRTLYRIADPSLRFWFRVYSPHRSRWARYSVAERRKLVEEHAAAVLENELRMRFREAGRYWESSAEFDLVRSDPNEPTRIEIAELKWKPLGKREREVVRSHIATQAAKTRLAGRVAAVRVLDSADAIALLSTNDEDLLSLNDF